jgi:hypothetical protein
MVMKLVSPVEAFVGRRALRVLGSLTGESEVDGSPARGSPFLVEQ